MINVWIYDKQLKKSLITRKKNQFFVLIKKFLTQEKLKKKINKSINKKILKTNNKNKKKKNKSIHKKSPNLMEKTKKEHQSYVLAFKLLLFDFLNKIISK